VTIFSRPALALGGGGCSFFFSPGPEPALGGPARPKKKHIKIPWVRTVMKCAAHPCG